MTTVGIRGLCSRVTGVGVYVSMDDVNDEGYRDT